MIDRYMESYRYYREKVFQKNLSCYKTTLIVSEQKFAVIEDLFYNILLKF
jgi:hypothetical protein